MKKDVYQNITDQIVSELEKGVRPWHQPWSASHMDGRVVLPLRHNGIAYRGVNIITLWMASLAKGYSAPIWMTFKQAIDLGGCVRKGEKGSLTVYADKITRTETDSASGEDSEREIHYMKGYTVFNVEQIDGFARAIRRACDAASRGKLVAVAPKYRHAGTAAASRTRTEST